jgi:hypothetical protein
VKIKSIICIEFQGRGGEFYHIGKKQHTLQEFTSCFDVRKVEINPQIKLPVAVVSHGIVFMFMSIKHFFGTISKCEIKPAGYFAIFIGEGVNVKRQPVGMPIVILKYFLCVGAPEYFRPNGGILRVVKRKLYLYFLFV